MKHFNYSLFIAALAAASFTFSACSDDDDQTITPNPEQVFTSGTLKNFDGLAVTKNANGLITQISDDNDVYTFNYSSVTIDSVKYDLTIEYKDTENDGDPSDNMTMYCKLNKDNFISEVYQIDGEGDIDTWTFGYNTDGQLNYMKRSEGGNEVTTLTYKDGDIIEVTETKEAIETREAREDKEDIKTSTITYTSETVTSKIANKGNIMLFDICFGVDIDEMEVAYYAGLLGKSTKNLPVARLRNNSDGDYTETFSWTLNKAGLPTEMKTNDNDSYTFTW